MKRILITGATGQIGSELPPALCNKYGTENVIAAGHTRAPTKDTVEAGPYCQLDARDVATLQATVREQQIDTLHLASIIRSYRKGMKRSGYRSLRLRQRKTSTP